MGCLRLSKSLHKTGPVNTPGRHRSSHHWVTHSLKPILSWSRPHRSWYSVQQATDTYLSKLSHRVLSRMYDRPSTHFSRMSYVPNQSVSTPGQSNSGTYSGKTGCSKVRL